MIKRKGGSTLEFSDMPRIYGFSSVVGKKEGEGPLKDDFDKIFYDMYLVRIRGKKPRALSRKKRSVLR